MIYLDNAATSFPKPVVVYRETTRCMREYCANPGRGGHAMSIKAGKAITEARETVSNFFNIRDPMQLCFTKNATEALNMAIKGIMRPCAHVITTGMEHNSVMRPLKTLERDLGIHVTILPGNSYGEIAPEDIKKNIRRNTVLIVSTLSSNVNGVIMPVDEIGRISRDMGIPFLLDASQGAGTLPVDVERQNIDLLAFPGHKGLMGPQGTGGLYVREGVKLRSLYEGGTGSNSESMYQPEIMPDHFESGTLNTPGIIGLAQGIRFINERGIENIRKHKQKLTARLLEGIGDIAGAKLYSKSEMSSNSGIAAVNLDGGDPSELSYILDKEYGIATRAGYHCSPLAHKTLGTSETGLVRFSPGCFNSNADIDFVIRAMEKITAKMKKT